MPSSTKTRPEFVKCVSLAVGPHGKDVGKTWCGRLGATSTTERPAEDLPRLAPGTQVEYNVGSSSIFVLVPSMEFMFVDATHALLNARNGGRLLICPECAAAIRTALRSGTWIP